MKRSSLILLSILAFQSVQSFRQHAPPHPPFRRDMDSSDSDSSMSSEEDSIEDSVMTKNQKQRIDPDRMIQLQQKQNGLSQNRFEENKKKFFDRPSSEELEAYDAKVRNQKNNRMIGEEPVMIQGPIDPIREPKPMKPKMDDTDEKLFLTALGQIYLDKLDEGRDNERFPGPIGPMGPPPPVDYDYLFVPYETPSKVESNNNGNNNVHVNVNHVQVNSNVLHLPEKDKKMNEKHEEAAPIIPAYHYSEPVSSSNYLYFNFNMVDCVIFAVLFVAFCFATKKAYKKCFPKKTVAAPQLPTTLPPTYSPSLTVETVSKKTPQ
uniref:Pv-fam-d protein n=1 Tax=Caenorhabditis tropicalis TaxID=1561998 RepID=A0A1I7UAT3_9PELO